MQNMTWETAWNIVNYMYRHSYHVSESFLREFWNSVPKNMLIYLFSLDELSEDFKLEMEARNE